MVTMLLVEDESFERASLRTCIDWELVGVRIVDEASNGAQGLAKVMELHPDIVLADIKMPVMDGIEMSQKIKTITPATKILFISSYDDFEYARQAVNLQAIAYVTKPVNEGELLKIVKRAVDEISEKALEQNLNNKIKNNYNSNLNLARQAIINRALSGLHINREEASNLGLPWLLSQQDHLCLMLSVFDKDKTEAADGRLLLLNRKTAKICSQSISACTSAGVLVTIAARQEEIDERAVHALKETLHGFFEELGCKDVKLETALANDRSASPASLYLQVLQNSAGYAYPAAVCSFDKKNKQQLVDDIVQIIHTQYHSALTIESIAKALHFTPNYIGSVFKYMKKVGINRYLNGYRLERARALLQGQDMPINDIAVHCGYDNITYFYTVFKKEYGITPSEYRQQLAGDGEAYEITAQL